MRVESGEWGVGAESAEPEVGLSDWRELQPGSERERGTGDNKQETADRGQKGLVRRDHGLLFGLEAAGFLRLVHGRATWLPFLQRERSLAYENSVTAHSHYSSSARAV
jgi:hypothetical protein